MKTDLDSPPTGIRAREALQLGNCVSACRAVICPRNTSPSRSVSGRPSAQRSGAPSKSKDGCPVRGSIHVIAPVRAQARDPSPIRKECLRGAATCREVCDAEGNNDGAGIAKELHLVPWLSPPT